MTVGDGEGGSVVGDFVVGGGLVGAAVVGGGAVVVEVGVRGGNVGLKLEPELVEGFEPVEGNGGAVGGSEGEGGRVE